MTHLIIYKRAICLNQGFSCGDKTSLPKGKMERKMFIYLTLPHCFPSLKEIRTGSQTQQMTGDRSWFRSHGRVLLSDLFPMICSAWFLTKCRTTSPGIAPPSIIWGSSINCKIRICPILWKWFLNWGLIPHTRNKKHQKNRKAFKRCKKRPLGPLATFFVCLFVFW